MATTSVAQKRLRYVVLLRTQVYELKAFAPISIEMLNATWRFAAALEVKPQEKENNSARRR
jgi:hypothetical protein